MTTAPCESPFADRTIFVIGTRRSGTTWLSELLMAHPDVGGPGTFVANSGDVWPMESLIFGALADLWVNRFRADRDGICAFMDDAACVAAFRRFCDQIFEAARNRHSPEATWYLDKSPDNLYRIPILADTYPDAWNVHIVRDGREVVRSLLAAPFVEVHSAADAASEWTKHVSGLVRHKRHLARLREIKYEQLLLNPVGETVQLFEWMGLPVNNDVVDRVQERVGRQVARFGSTGPPRLGKWRDMDPDDLAMTYEIAGDLLAELGYLDEADTPA